MTDSLETIVVLSDWQVPLHNERLIKNVAHFIWDFQPDQVAHVGDATDSTQIGRWVRGLRGEFNGGLEGGLRKTRELFAYTRRGYSGPWTLVRSNHDDRLELAIEQRLPGVAGLTVRGHALNIQNALCLDDFGITWRNKPFELAPGVMLMHGDEGGLSQMAGHTALGLARRARVSVVCGHTHRAGLAWDRDLFGMEVGHAMNVDAAEYLGPARLNNWKTAFGILRVYRGNKEKARVYPQLIDINADGSFVVDGVRYR